MTQDYCYVAACLLDGQICFSANTLIQNQEKNGYSAQLLPHNVKLLV